MKPLHGAVVALTLALISAAPLDARIVRPWSNQDLLNASDIVAVVEPIANEDNSDQWEWMPKFAQGVTTTFKVLCYFKGGKPGEDTIRVKHFLYKSGVPPNGGTMIHFFVKPLQVDGTFTRNGKSESWSYSDHPHWLAFLKKSSDGFWVPTSGQVDPDFSFLELLHDVSMFDPTHGMLH